MGRVLAETSGTLPHPLTTTTTQAKLQVRTRVEPKTFFANERTFLTWLSTSALILFMSLNLLAEARGAGVDSKCTWRLDPVCFASLICGALIAPIAISFMVYALYIFKARSRAILHRSAFRYDDQTGPVVLTVCLIFAASAALGTSLVLMTRA